MENEYTPSPTLPELAARKWSGDKKMHVKVIEICSILKRKRLKDEFDVDIKRMAAMQALSEEVCVEVIKWYEDQLLDTKFVIV